MKKIIVINIVIIILAFLFLSKSSAATPESLNLKLLKMSKLDLTEAIKIATREISGQPIEAHLESKPDKQEPVFKVTILKSGIFVVVSIDGRTGKITDTASLPQGIMPSFQAESAKPTAPIEKGPEAVSPLEKGPEPLPSPAEEEGSAPAQE